ncbi:MAG: VWA domain-containing protein [Bacteroidales bacterium]|nr:VWA domain-containing protein [Bacteroidales bacterium]MBN2757473.1 VWA domain-containing protein [Bacteroidales bacterium]
MFNLANPQYLYAFALIPILIVIYIITKRIRKKQIEIFGEEEILSKVMPLVSTRRPNLKFILLIIALSLVIFSISRPQFGSKLKEVKTEGVEIIIALDVSNSMLAQDIKPNRLEKAKRSISKLLDNLHNDKIGLIVFAGKAYTQVPITTDYSATKMFLSSINTDFIPVQGTAIGEAIRLGIKSFGPENESKKVLIIITDGENHEDNPLQAAVEAKEKGILVYTIGMGDNRGVPIPIVGSSDYRKDNNNNVIITKLNENMLIDIANAGGGIYIRANNFRTGLSKLYDEIEKLDKTELEAYVYSDYEDVFQYIIFLALMIILFDFLILERKNRKLEKLKLFNLRL